MKKILFFSFLFLFFIENSNAQCDSTKWAKDGTYEVYIIPGSVESSDVQPRVLSGEEKCMVETNRHLTNVVIMQLDLFTEVKIYSLSQITEK